MEYVVQTFDLKKRYKRHFALDGVNMNIEKGDIYGFVGENGSGKTTVIRTITGLISATSGSFSLFGIAGNSNKINCVKRKIGAVVETPSIYRNMSAVENLKMQGAILEINNPDTIIQVLNDVGLGELATSKKSAGDFSLGMRQRLGIAMALLGNPELLILDEPMNGLDPAGIVEVRELILKLNREKGITFLISSHILTELSLVATKYGIISKGKIIKEISAEQLIHECRPTVTVESDNLDALQSVALQFKSSEDISYSTNGITLHGELDINAFITSLVANGITIKNINCTRSNIEDYYLSLVGGGKNA